MAQILLIEPDRQLADTYRQGLEAHSHQVIMCASAQSAIFAADEVKPDIIVLEIQLIGHSGIEFLYELRSYPDWQNIPVLVHSQVPPAEFQEGWHLLREELGIEAYLYKPLTSLATLLRNITTCLSPAHETTAN